MISIVVPTWNRGTLLSRTLESLCGLKVGEGLELELLLVLNACTDDSESVARGFQDEFPGEMRILSEPQPGVGHARNRGLSEARGEIIALTDDDVLLDDRWAQEIARAFCDSTVAGVAGRILPLGTVEFPKWFDLQRFPGILVQYDLGDEAFDLSRKYPAAVSANMALRRECVRELGEFRTDLDRESGQLLGGGDTEYFGRFLEAGLRFRYVPTATVYHPVQKERLTKDYVRRWHTGGGVAWARIFGERERSFPQFFGVPRHRVRSILEHSLAWLGGAVKGRPSLSFYHEVQLRSQIAFCREYRRLMKRSAGRGPSASSGSI